MTNTPRFIAQFPDDPYETPEEEADAQRLDWRREFVHLVYAEDPANQCAEFDEARAYALADPIIAQGPYACQLVVANGIARRLGYHCLERAADLARAQKPTESGGPPPLTFDWPAAMTTARDEGRVSKKQRAALLAALDGATGLRVVHQIGTIEADAETGRRPWATHGFVVVYFLSVRESEDETKAGVAYAAGLRKALEAIYPGAFDVENYVGCLSRAPLLLPDGLTAEGQDRVAVVAVAPRQSAPLCVPDTPTEKETANV